VNVLLFINRYPDTNEILGVWIKWWSETNSRQPNKDIGLYMGIYAMLGVIGTFGILMAAW